MTMCVASGTLVDMKTETTETFAAVTGNSNVAVRMVIAALATGAVIHCKDTNDKPITAGRVAAPGKADAWMIYHYASPGCGLGGEPIAADDCGTMQGVARVLVRTYVGPAAASAAALRFI